MNAVTVLHQQGSNRALTAVDVRQHVNLIQEVMRSVMKQDVHYGVIPGCKQPSLYKAGSEVLLTTFRIAISVSVEDLSTDDVVRYRVRTIGTHQPTGIVVGEGIGECSSEEAKYKWRRCYIKQEFERTPESRRRIKYSQPKGSTKVYEDMEVRTEPADVANTVLKMAKKRAQIDLTLTATAASDIFTQDVEDLPEGMVSEGGSMTPEQQAATRKAEHDEAFGRHSESIAFIKEKIAEGDMQAVADEWGAISQADQMALWLAPSKGGCLTTLERATIKEKLPKAPAQEQPE